MNYLQNIIQKYHHFINRRPQKIKLIRISLNFIRFYKRRESCARQHKQSCIQIEASKPSNG